MTNPSKTQTAFFRRIYMLWLIDQGIDNVPAITEQTGMPRRTVQDTLKALHELGVRVAFEGANRNGGYSVIDWGPINRNWIGENLPEIKAILGIN